MACKALQDLGPGSWPPLCADTTFLLVCCVSAILAFGWFLKHQVHLFLVHQDLCFCSFVCLKHFFADISMAQPFSSFRPLFSCHPFSDQAV